MPICPKVVVSPPAVQRYGYGLYSVVQQPQPEGDHWRCGVMWEPYACDAGEPYGDQCDDPGVDKPVRDGVPLVEADAFTVYDGYLCRLPGRPSEAEVFDRARTALELGEQRTVELVVWTGLAGTQIVEPHLASPDAVVVNAVMLPTADDALALPAAIAALEDYAACNYGGQPVIHAPRGVAELMQARYLLERDGAVLRTILGTPVAFYGCSPNTGPDGSEAPPGTAWIYITGPVAMRRGPVLVAPESLAAALDRTTNEVYVLAEREVVIGWDCIHAAVLADISCA